MKTKLRILFNRVSYSAYNSCLFPQYETGGSKLPSVLISNKSQHYINKNEVLPQISKPIMKSVVVHFTKLQEI